MTRRPARFTQADIIRAVKGAEAAGLGIAGIICHPDGSVEIKAGQPIDAVPKDPPSSLDQVFERLKARGINGEAGRAR